MKITVISNKHGLLPFAWRLKKEGAEVSTVVVKDRYEKAWAGLLEKDLVGRQKSQESWQGLSDSLRQDGSLVLCDSPKVVKTLSGYEGLYGIADGNTDSPGGLIVAGWLHPSAGILRPHYLLPDYGLQSGGQGPAVLSGAVLYRPQSRDLFSSKFVPLEAMEQSGHKGLFYCFMKFNTVTTELELDHFWLGWHPILSQISLAEEELLPLLDGKADSPKPQYTIGVVVSVPPYPYECNLTSSVRPIQYPSSDLLKDVFFHDVTIEGNNINVAGTDGLVAIVRGTSSILEHARKLATLRSSALSTPEIQFRQDVGSRVSTPLAALEGMGLL